MHRSALFLVFLAVLAGCPDSKSGHGGDAATIDSGVPLSGKIKKKPGEAKPVEPAAKKDDPFPREELIELYKAEQVGDAFAAKKKYGLLDAHGKDVPAKIAEYEAALVRFANEHGDELSKIADELEAERAKAAGGTDVQKK